MFRPIFSQRGLTKALVSSQKWTPPTLGSISLRLKNERSLVSMQTQQYQRPSNCPWSLTGGFGLVYNKFNILTGSHANKNIDDFAKNSKRGSLSNIFRVNLHTTVTTNGIFSDKNVEYDKSVKNSTRSQPIRVAISDNLTKIDKFLCYFPVIVYTAMLLAICLGLAYILIQIMVGNA